MVEIPKKLEMILRWTAIILIILAVPMAYEAFTHYNLNILWWEVAVCISAAASGVALFLYLSYNFWRFSLAIVLPIIAFVILLVIRIIAIRSEKEETPVQKIIPWIGMALALISAIIIGAGLAQWSDIVKNGIFFILLDLNLLTAIMVLTLPWTLAYLGMGFSISAFIILLILEIFEIKERSQS